MKSPLWFIPAAALLAVMTNVLGGWINPPVVTHGMSDPGCISAADC